MKYLLDTHYILWSLFDPDKISPNIKSILLDAEKEKYVSGISLWEISLKYGLGKLTLHNVEPEEILKNIRESGFYLLDIDNELFASYHKLPQKENHKDPFDRLLIWQAINNDFSLLSKDSKIEQYSKDGLQLILGH